MAPLWQAEFPKLVLGIAQQCSDSSSGGDDWNGESSIGAGEAGDAEEAGDAD